MASPVHLLRDRRLLVVTGKGGVGKTTVSAAVAAALAGIGRRVLLLEVDPRESAHQLLEVPPSAGEIVPVSAGLYLQNLSPRRVMDEVVRERLRLEALVRRVLASPMYEHFAGGAPGLKELALLGHAWRVLHGRAGAGTPRVDIVVLDAPATGHGVSLLRSPAAVAEVISSGPFARMARDITAFVGSVASCGVVVVTTLAEMPVQEALELHATLPPLLGRPLDLLVANAVLPPLAADADTADAAAATWQRRYAAQRRELERLKKSWAGPFVSLPLLPLSPGRALVEALRFRLAGETP